LRRKEEIGEETRGGRGSTIILLDKGKKKE